VGVDDGGEPATEGVGAELGGGEAEKHEDFEELEVCAVEQAGGEAERGEGGEESGVEAAADAHVEHRAEEKDADAPGEDGGGDGGDLSFGDMLRGEELRQWNGDESGVEAEGEIGHTHEPDGCGAAAKVQTNLLW
jgi:hypothetical protein